MVEEWEDNVKKREGGKQSLSGRRKDKEENEEEVWGEVVGKAVGCGRIGGKAGEGRERVDARESVRGVQKREV